MTEAMIETADPATGSASLSASIVPGLIFSACYAPPTSSFEGCRYTRIGTTQYLCALLVLPLHLRQQLLLRLRQI